MDNNFENRQKKSTQVKSKRLDYVIIVIVSIVFSVFVMAEGIQKHQPVIGTSWFVILFVVSCFISEKLELDNAWFFRRFIFGAIFFLLLLVSYLIYLPFKYIGLDLLEWKF